MWSSDQILQVPYPFRIFAYRASDPGCGWSSDSAASVTACDVKSLNLSWYLPSLPPVSGGIVGAAAGDL